MKIGRNETKSLALIYLVLMVYLVVFGTSIVGFVSATFIQGTVLVSGDDLFPVDITTEDMFDDNEAIYAIVSMSCRDPLRNSFFIYNFNRELISNLLLTDLPPPL